MKYSDFYREKNFTINFEIFLISWCSVLIFKILMYALTEMVDKSSIIENTFINIINLF